MSKIVGVLIASMALTATVVTGCMPVYRDMAVRKSQAIQVTSEPTGALISIRNEDGSRIVGKTPIQFEETYSLIDREYDKGACALSGGAAVADAVSHDGIHSDAEAVGTLIGMVLGAAIGAASCAEADGIVAVQPRSVIVNASLAGFYPQEVEVQIPKDRDIMHFEMVPAAAAAPPVKEVSVQPVRAGLPGRVAVFAIQVAPGQLDPVRLEELSAYLATSIRDTEVLEVVDPIQIRPRLVDASGQVSECADMDCRIRVAQEFSADQLLDTRILLKDGMCLVSASLFDSSTRKQKLVAATRTACQQDDLIATMDKITELLINPPQRELLDLHGHAD